MKPISLQEPPAKQQVSLMHVLRLRAEHQGDRCAYWFLRNRGRKGEAVTYLELDRQARIIAGLLQDNCREGARVLLLFPPGLDYIAAFFGCLYAGMVAVPIYPPRPNQKQSRVENIIASCEPEIALTDTPTLSTLRHFGLTSCLIRQLPFQTTSELEDEHALLWHPPSLHKDSLAFLQYTSGSTGKPKGVMVTHGNLMANEAVIGHAIRSGPDDVFLNWLPLYHDMGLIGNILHPVYAGIPSVLLAPVSFIQDAARWLEAITWFRATVCGGPNFGYALCVKKVRPERLKHIDLRCWRIAYNGSEPIRAATLKQFFERFRVVGFGCEAFYPCYGMAEATLFITGSIPSSVPRVGRFEAEALNRNRAIPVDSVTRPAIEIVACGTPQLEHEIAIVDAECFEERAEMEIGEIWVKGPSIAVGYWNLPEETSQAFNASLPGSREGGYLRTGDLGFLAEGELFITGRLKDLIIIRGRNFYPHDIEFSAEKSHGALRAGCGAAFSVEIEDQELLVVLQEVERRAIRNLNPAQVIEAIQARISEEHEVRAHAVVLLKPGGVEKTTSGKIRRRACRQKYLEGNLNTIEGGTVALAEPAEAPPVLDRETLIATPSAERIPLLRWYLLQKAAAIVNTGANRIDPHKTLIQSGFDSLMTLELQNHLEEAFGLSIPLARLLGESSFSDLAKEILTGLNRSGKAEARIRPITDIPPDFGDSGESFPLSYNQQALWYLYRIAPHSAAYNLAFAFKISADLEIDVLTAAFQTLVERHPSLHTSYAQEEDLPRQKVRDDLVLDFQEIEASSWSLENLQAYLKQEAHRPFDLTRGTQPRFRLLHRGTHGYIFMVVAHHIAVDLNSLLILLEEWGTLYASRNDRGFLKPLLRNYADFVTFQAYRLKGRRGARLWEYWRKQLQDAPPFLDIPTDRPRPPHQTFEGAVHDFNMGEALSEKIKLLSGALGATRFTTLLTAFQTFLYHYSGQEEIVVGSPASCRDQTDFQEVVGYFINPVVLRGDLRGNPSFHMLVDRTRHTVIEALAHRDFPFQWLTERLNPARDTSRSPLFQAMFILQTPHRLEAAGGFLAREAGARMDLGGLSIESMAIEQRFSQFDLTLSMVETSRNLTARIEYNTDLFEPATVALWADHLQNLLAAVVANPEARLSEISLLDDEERRRILKDWNETERPFPKEMLVHQLFEARAANAPDSIAVAGGDSRLSYAALENHAERLARLLRKRGIRPETRVAICIERTPAMVVGLLAILKAGGAYVPLDPSYPEARLAFTMQDAKVEILLTQPELVETLPRGTPPVFLHLGGEIPPSSKKYLAHIPPFAPAPTTPANLSHLIYTSGTTGQPKGVAITHRSTVALMDWAGTVFDAELSGCVLASTSLCFDLSVFEIFATLAHGGRVILAENALALTTLPQREEVGLLNTVPSAVRELLATDGLPRSVTTVNLAGEPLQGALVRQLYRLETIRRVFNLYGPSEDTTYSSFTLADDTLTNPTIGRPIANTRLYLLERHLQPVPPGVRAEMFLGGDGLARGYLGRPTFTAQKFVPDPYSRKPGFRLYRTGDLGRYLGNGEIDFLGRGDRQVKLRGFRIELGEIEAALDRHPLVSEAVVSIWGNRGESHVLTAYFVPGEPRPPSGWDPREFLAGMLPSFMIPSAWVELAALPLTPNGKINYHALPAPNFDRRKRDASSMPRTPLQEVLISLWAEVLGLEWIGLQDNFFEIGGHSVLAIRLISRVRDAFSIDLPLQTLLEAPTIAALSERVEALRRQGESKALPKIVLVERGGSLPLSSAQARLWFLDRLESSSVAYNMPFALHLRGSLDVRALEKSFAEIIGRHEVFSTAFADDHGNPVQWIHAPRGFCLVIADLKLLPTALRQVELTRLTSNESRMPFDLGHAPLIRLLLLQIGSEENSLCATIHHIISDGWSVGLLVDELASIYTSQVGGAPHRLPKPGLQYADYAHYQSQWLASKGFQEQMSYWKQHLSGIPELIHLPSRGKRPSPRAFAGFRIEFEIQSELARSLSALSRRSGTTLFMTMQAAFAVLLSHYSTQKNVVIGFPIANRSREEWEPVIGFFVNTLPLRCDLSGDPGFDALLTRVRHNVLCAHANQDTPFERIVEALLPHRNPGHNPIFQVMFNLEYDLLEERVLPGLKMMSRERDNGTAKFDLGLSLRKTGDRFLGSMEYNTLLFDEETPRRMARHFRNILASVCGQPRQRISQIALLDEKERKQILTEWNPSPRRHVSPAPIHHVFENRANHAPDAVAVVSGRVGASGAQLSFGALQAASNRIALLLQSHGVGSEMLVGLITRRSNETVAAILGILKAGGAYVPMEPDLPRERFEFVLRDAPISVLISDEELSPPVLDHPLITLTMKSALRPKTAASPHERIGFNQGGSPQILAYVIYTSGSTGRPKGVAVSHGNVTRLFTTTEPWFRFASSDIWTCFHSFAFDFSVWELWGALLYGGRLVLVSQWLRRSPESFYDLLRQQRITVLNQTPSAFEQLHRIEAERGRHASLALRLVVFGGEALIMNNLTPWFERHGDGRPRLVNMYGITETTVHVTYRPLTREDANDHASTIGIPVPDLKIHILNSGLQPMPSGVAGEICVGGAGCARAYLRRPDLTAPRFVPDPFSGLPGERLYRSGDLARYRPDGQIEYLGREDNQVKIRGFRIELGEIASALAVHARIQKAVVVANGENPGEKRLLAYLQTKGGQELEGLREFLAQKLPDYMLPSAFITLQEIPLTANGKVDHRALPKPSSVPGTAAYVPPRDSIETGLASIWAEVLELPRVGIHESFFELGGHSLIATRVVSRIREAFALELPLRRLFLSPTIAALAEHLRQSAIPATELPPILPRDRQAAPPLSFAQQRLWFLHRLGEAGGVYNIATALRLEGRLETAALARSLASITDRHEVLRTLFRDVDGSPACMLSSHPLVFPIVDFGRIPAPQRPGLVQGLAELEARRDFDLSRGPLLRPALLRCSALDHVLLITLHHIVADGWSTGILARELGVLYRARLAGTRSPPLAEPAIQYADFAQWQRDQAGKPFLARQAAYWKKQLAGAPQQLTLTTDRPRPALESHEGDSLVFELDGELTRQLHRLGRTHRVTLFMTLLAAFEILLAHYSGQEDILVGTPIANRNRKEIEGLIGFFVNTLVLRADLSRDLRFTELLHQVSATTLAAYAHQDLAFEKLVETLNPERDLSHGPLFQVMFILQNAPAADLDLPGLRSQTLALPRASAKFDLTLAMEETRRGLCATLEYNTILFQKATMERLARHFRLVLETLSARPTCRLSELSPLTPGERHQLLIAWNETGAEAQPPASLHGLFEDQVRRSPDAIALVWGTDRLGYGELERRSDRLAFRLRRQGTEPETLVGLCLPRKPELIVALLAILKAGGVYLALDANHPRRRLALSLEHARLLLTCRELRGRMPETGPDLLLLEDEEPDARPANTATRVRETCPEQLSHVIYTSGSTGIPKGVAVRHGAVVTLLRWAAGIWPPRQRAGVLASTSVCFDLSVFEIFGPLSWGGTILLAENVLDLPNLPARDAVSLINTVPSAMSELLGLGPPPPSVRAVNLAGEPLHAGLVRRLYRLTRIEAVYNLYGPSEDTTYSTWSRVSRQSRYAPTIGRPIDHSRVYPLNRWCRPVPPGVAGELYLGGKGLARGYVRRPDLSATQFIPDPHGTEPGGRLYRTGDQARFLPSGELEFLGRRDLQVKIRGFRIELAEIETLLARHPLVAEVVVTAREDGPGGGSLAAYVRKPKKVESGDQAKLAKELRDYLRERVPGYMLPAGWVFLESFPRNPSGKVNRAALPKPFFETGAADQRGPRDALEARLVDIFAEVLEKPSAGIHGNFFDLGGHSLLAVRATARMGKALAMELPLRLLFGAPTVAELARAIRELDVGVHRLEPIPRISRSGPLPLSDAQSRLWFLDQMEGPNATYNMPLTPRLRGMVSIALLERSLALLLERHEAPRGTFSVEDGNPRQRIHPPEAVICPVVDLGRLAEPPRSEAMNRLLDEEAGRPFDLGQGPLWRTLLLWPAPDDVVFRINLHHIVCDGWSLGILLREWISLYRALLLEKPASLPALSIQYADYAHWHKTEQQGQAHVDRRNYWRTQLEGMPELHELPTDRPRPALQTNRGAEVGFEIGERLVRGLHILSRESRTTLFMTLEACFAILLARYSGRTDIAVGTPVANRNRAETEPLIGFFVNTLVLRNDLAGEPTCRELLERVRRTALDAYTHAEYPFEQLVELMHPQRATSYAPLCQVVFALHQAAAFPNPPGALLSYLERPGTVSKFDLTLTMEASGTRLRGTATYNRDLFDAATIVRMMTHLQTLMASLAEDPERRVTELEILSAEERRQILMTWNATRSELPEQGGLHQVFSTWARRVPDRIALVLGKNLVSYGQLEARAVQIARRLRLTGIGSETVIAIHAGLGPHLVAGVFGILKAGGAYLVLDPDYPEDQLRFLIEDAQASAVLAGKVDRGVLASAGVRVLDLDVVEEEAIGMPPSKLECLPGQSAYVIYTSGSTGRPKGIRVAHSSVLAHHNGFEWIAPSTDPLIGTSVGALGFDALVWEFFSNLCYGGTLHLCGQVSLIDTEGFVDYLISRQVNSTFLPPGILDQVAGLFETGNRSFPLRRMLVGVEPIKQGTLQRFRNLSSRVKIVNGYGPAETTICATFFDFLTQRDAFQRVPIGKRVEGYQVYLLDHRLEPGPFGVKGEVFIGGAGLSPGYLNLPDQTARRFIPHPFTPKPGRRLYRSGDQAYFLADGNIVFSGRADHQIKIRGFRIEPGEIEAVLAEYPEVEESFVMVGEEDQGNRYLSAYITWKSMPHDDPPERSEQAQNQACTPFDIEKIRDFLARKLPPHMIPPAIFCLQSLPMTAHGKVDRAALPKAGQVDSARARQPPRTLTEEMMATVWADILSKPVCFASDDFFELGGHSILITRVISRVRDLFSIDLPVKTFFEATTLKRLCEHIDSLRRGAVLKALPPITPMPRDRQPPLSFAQERFWFLTQLEGPSATYNMPASVELQGMLDTVVLEGAVQEILRRHASLRGYFPARGGGPIQAIRAGLEFELGEIDLSDMEGREPERNSVLNRLSEAFTRQPFDLGRGPLFRAYSLRIGKQVHVLLINMHHIVSDGWSFGVFFSELAILYRAFSAGQASPLPEPPIQYADFAHWQRQCLQGKGLDQHIAYWKEQLAEVSPLKLPIDVTADMYSDARGGLRTLCLAEPLVGRLKALGGSEGATLFMTLLSAFATLLHRITGAEDVVVGTPIAGRHLSQTEALIGCFLNTLALRINFFGNPTFRELLARTRRTALDAYTHQDPPFERLVEELKPGRNLNRHPFFDIMLNFNNNPETRVELPGLSLRSSPLAEPNSKFWMTLYVDEQDGCLSMKLLYRCALFSSQRIDILLAQLQQLLLGMVEDPGAPVDSYSMVDPVSQSFLPNPARDLQAPDYPPVPVLFGARAMGTPSLVAISWKGRTLTYGELDLGMEEIAGNLALGGIGKDDVVAVYGARSFGFIAAMMGVLRCGAVLLTLDPMLPAQRRELMMRRAKTRCLLRVEGRPGAGDDWKPELETLVLDPNSGRVLAPHPDREPERITVPVPSSEDAAYVFFTSGTTGIPRGVLGWHKGLSHFLEWQRRTFDISSGDRCGQLTALSFDVVLRDILVGLVSGATLCLPRDEQILDSRYLLPWLERNRISLCHTVPALAHVWLMNVPANVSLSAMRWVFFAGEALTSSLLNRWRRTFPESGALVNLYGPTETTLAKCFYQVPDDPRDGIQPIGRPLPHTQILILGRNKRPCGVGEPGEIVIRTPFRSLGYLETGAGDQGCFTPNPYSESSDDLLYFSGDRGRYRPGGTVEILGRLDFQIKVRGVRVELGEIEATLAECPDVRDNVVVAREIEGGSYQLIAYVTPSADEHPDPIRLRSFLKQRLLDAMIPAVFVIIERMPLAANGKIDRERLPRPVPLAADENRNNYRTQTEEILAGIWREILPGAHAGVDDDFFDMGGHSLLANLVISRIRDAFSIHLPLRELFRAPTIAGLARAIEGHDHPGKNLLPAIKPVARDRSLPLSFSQERLWFLDQLEGGSANYNTPLCFELNGLLDALVLEQSLTAILERHETLRSTFPSQNGLPIQKILDPVFQLLPVVDLRGLRQNEVTREASRLSGQAAMKPFTLSRDLMLRTFLFRLGPARFQLSVTTHHIVSDAWSLGVFAQELTTFYQGFSAGRRPELPRLPVQFADFAIWERELMEGGFMKSSLSFWKKHLEGVPLILELPCDHRRPKRPSSRGARLEISLDGTHVRDLKALTRERGGTLFMTLLAGFQILIFKFSSQKSFVIGTSDGNRDRRELEGLIGFFINQLLIRSHLEDDPSFAELLKRVRTEMLAIYEHRHMPFHTLARTMLPRRDPSRNPLFQVLFILQNTPRAELTWNEGLEVEPVALPTPNSRLDAMISISEREDELFVVWEYSTDLFERETIEQLLQAYRGILVDCTSRPDMRVSEFRLPPSLSEKAAVNGRPPTGSPDLALHHQGYACAEIAESLAYVRETHDVKKVIGPVFDELQNATVCMVEITGGNRIELVEGPAVASLVGRGIHLYHVCYEVENLREASRHFMARGATVVSQPKPAILFDYRHVTFLNTPLGLVELLEAARSEIPGVVLPELHEGRPTKQAATIAISATFTAEPLGDSLEFWMRETDLPLPVAFAPYNQVFQQLLDPSSLLARNRDGFNVILVRFGDWARYSEGAPRADQERQICKNVEDLIAALRSYASGSRVPCFVLRCPEAPDAPEEELFEKLERKTAADLARFEQVHLVPAAEIRAAYPASSFYDPHADKTGHVPYTQEFFSGLGTLIARMIHASQRPPFKVIVLDCDQTLWGGICGEDGPDGVRIEGPYRMLQEFMVQQENAGKLLCLCSKNREEDVLAVFENRHEMPLRTSHIVASRVNWRPKSENIRSLAEELNLDLDSFIFLDDNPIEIAEVRAYLPRLLSLTLPAEPSRIPQFLKGVWSFDQLKVTGEDRKRTQRYRQNAEREDLYKSSISFRDFLASLQLEVTIDTITSHQLERVSQLTRRTNQFNATTIRRGENEIAELIDAGGLECFTVGVKDRFGDYGLVGLVMFRVGENALEADTFLLSCRAMGKGVEHRMLAYLGRFAEERGLEQVIVPLIPSARNQPIREFLDSLAEGSVDQTEKGYSYRFQARAIAGLEYRPTAKKEEVSGAPKPSGSKPPPAAQSVLFENIARELSSAARILAAVRGQKRRSLNLAAPSPPHRSPTEEILAGIWEEVLNLERIGIHDNFFELKGHSLLATRVMSRIQATLEVDLPLSEMFDFPTIAGLSRRIDEARGQDSGQAIEPIEPVARHGGLPLSFAQQRLWFMDRLNPANPLYNVISAIELRGSMDLIGLEQACNDLKKRHEILRSRFVSTKNEPVQIIDEAAPTLLPVVDLSRIGVDLKGVRGFALAGSLQCFDIEKTHPWRLCLYRTREDSFFLTLIMHHILTDGWSIRLMVAEVAKGYAARASEKPLPETVPPLNYADFAHWQRHHLQKAVFESQAIYWKKQLADTPPLVTLSGDRPRPQRQTHRGTNSFFRFGKGFTRSVNELGKQQGVTSFMVLLAGFSLLVHYDSQMEDLVIGTDVANRNRPGTEDMIGFFVNQLALRIDLHGNPTFGQILARVREVTLAAYAHQDLPFEKLVELLEPKRDPAYSPLFQTKLVLQNFPEMHGALKGVDLNFVEIERNSAQLDLILTFMETVTGFVCRFELNTDLFDTKTIQRLGVQLETLLGWVQPDPSLDLARLRAKLEENSRNRRKKGWNQQKDKGRRLLGTARRQAVRVPIEEP